MIACKTLTNLDLFFKAIRLGGKGAGSKASRPMLLLASRPALHSWDRS